MNEMAKKQEMAKQGLMMRLVTAVGEKLFARLCHGEMGMSPYESQMFMLHGGIGWEEAATYHHRLAALPKTLCHLDAHRG